MVMSSQNVTAAQIGLTVQVLLMYPTQVGILRLYSWAVAEIGRQDGLRIRW